MSRELLQQALDALETKYSDYIYDGAGSAIAGAFEDDVAALRAALAQPAPAVQVVLRQPNLFAADPAAPAVNCEWTNCPRRVGDVCCNDRPAAPAVPAVREQPDTAILEKALRRAFSLGQTYWQQADSDSYKENKRSDETRQKFETLIVETLSGITGDSNG